VMIGHSRVMIGHFRVMIGHFRVMIGHFRAMIGRSRAMIRYSRAVSYQSGASRRALGGPNKAQQRTPSRHAPLFHDRLSFLSTLTLEFGRPFGVTELDVRHD
jgi:hypothetical protein